MLQIDCAKPLQAHRPALDTHGMRQMNPSKVTFMSCLWSAQVCRDLVALELSADPQVAALQVRARALLTKSRSEKQFPTVEAVVRRAVAVVPGPSSDAPPRTISVTVRLGSKTLVTFPCPSCGREDIPSQASLSGHRRFCDGGKWECGWCGCKASEAGGKNPGPKGPSTLCSACGGRFRGGATGPLQVSQVLSVPFLHSIFQK